MSEIEESAPDQKEEAELTQFLAKKEFPINRIIPEDLPLTFSDGMVVKQQSGLFYLYFFQSRPPLTLTKEDLADIKQVDSICVAQILITPEQMEQNIKALISNFEKLPLLADLPVEKAEKAE